MWHNEFCGICRVKSEHIKLAPWLVPDPGEGGGLAWVCTACKKKLTPTR